jgi:prepilin-type N-terminal cleavage/methylation domain-containing protein
MRSNSGYTLVELMATIGIIALLAAVGLPNYVNWRYNAQLGRAARDFYSVFHQAKMTAVRTNQYCTAAFNQGGYDFVVFVDNDRDLALDAAEQIVSSISWSDYGGVGFDTTHPDDTNTPKTGIDFSGTPGSAVSFAPDGLPRDNGNSLASGSVYLKNKNGKRRRLEISIAGRIVIQ